MMPEKKGSIKSYLDAMRAASSLGERSAKSDAPRQDPADTQDDYVKPADAVAVRFVSASDIPSPEQSPASGIHYGGFARPAFELNSMKPLQVGRGGEQQGRAMFYARSHGALLIREEDLSWSGIRPPSHPGGDDGGLLPQNPSQENEYAPLIYAKAISITFANLRDKRLVTLPNGAASTVDFDSPGIDVQAETDATCAGSPDILRSQAYFEGARIIVHAAQDADATRVTFTNAVNHVRWFSDFARVGADDVQQFPPHVISYTAANGDPHEIVMEHDLYEFPMSRDPQIIGRSEGVAIFDVIGGRVFRIR